MKPAATFGDAETLQIDYLKSAFTGRSEAYKPTTVTTDFPTSALATTTHVQVELEPTSTKDYPIAERAPVRFTCYAPPSKRTWVKDLASLTQALVARQSGGTNVVGARVTIGRSNVITDPTTKNLMVWFTAEITLAPSVLT